jgi:hypothetical protein
LLLRRSEQGLAFRERTFCSSEIAIRLMLIRAGEIAGTNPFGNVRSDTTGRSQTVARQCVFDKGALP